MSERYSKLFTLPENLYATGSPVVIAAGALLKDNQTGKVLAQLKLRNIGKKTIKAATVCVEPLDTVGKPLGAPVTYQYLDLHADRDADFGQKAPIALPDSATRSFAVSVVQVIFADNSIWNDDSPAWKPLTRPHPLDALGDSELTKQFRIEYGGGCENLLLEQKDLWYCVCGGVNRQEEGNCHKCGKALVELQAIDLASLRKAKEERVAKERAEAEVARKEAEIARKKTAKIGVIAAAILAVVAIVAVLVTQVIIPSSKYNKAISYMDGGNYKEAIVAFEALEGYKDSVQKIQECEYQKAVNLMDQGQYDEAIAAFRGMDGYKDSAELIIEVELTKQDAENADAYSEAEVMLANQKFENAIAMFEALGDYSNSAEMVDECKYQNALFLMNQENYSDAANIFCQILEYKDASEYFGDLYFVPTYVECTYNTGNSKRITISYQADGKMSDAYRSTINATKETVYEFDKDGRLIRDKMYTGMYYRYVVNDDGTVWQYSREDESASYILDEYGNKVSYFYKEEWYDYKDYQYDTNHNRCDHSVNYYGDEGTCMEGMLTSVQYQKVNLAIQSKIEYVCLYVPDGKIDMDLVWKNFRIICGNDIWHS